jgi:hypothetical protein
MLQNICLRLSIPEVSALLPGLEAIDTTLRLLPQLQGFVTAVDSVVYNYHTRFADDINANHTVQNRDPPVSRLDDIIEVIGMWGRAAGDIGHLREFWRRVHNVLGIHEKGSRSMDDCLEAIRKLKESIVGYNEQGLLHNRAMEAKHKVSEDGLVSILSRQLHHNVQLSSLN